MSYTSIIVNSGTATVGTPIGITIPAALDDIQKDKKYVLQFKARPLNEKQLLDNIYVGNQKLSDVYIILMIRRPPRSTPSDFGTIENVLEIPS